VRQQQPSSKTKKSSPQSLTRESATQPSLRGRALRLLGRREFSRQELEGRLRGHADAGNPAELETLLDDLAQRGWLSDARYADTVVRKRTGQYSRRSIAQELKKAGVAPEVSDTALAALDPDEEFAAALALCRRKFRHDPVDQKEKARQIRFLQSRGYSLSLVLRVLKHRENKNSETE
jgi:regulatory protein